MGDVSSQDNKDYLILSKINEIIENQIMLSQQVEKLTKPIEDMEDADADARCKCKKEPQIAPNNDDGIFINDGTFILMKTDQLKHMVNTLTLLIDELINNIQ